MAVEDGEQSVTSYKLRVVYKVRKFVKLESKQENGSRNKFPVTKNGIDRDGKKFPKQ